MILGFLMIIAFSTATGNVIDLKNSQVLNQFSWWWIFFVIGAWLLIYTLQKEWETRNTEKGFFFFDAVIGILWSFTLACLSLLIVYVSIISSERSSSREYDTLTRILGQDQVESQSGITMSRAYSGINNLRFDRKNNQLSWSTQASEKGEKKYYEISGENAELWEKTLSEKSDIIFTDNERYILDRGNNTLSTASGNMISSDIKPIKNSIIAWSHSWAFLFEDSKMTEMQLRQELYQMNIRDISLSSDRKNEMILILSWGVYSIYKNNEKIHTILDGLIEKSYQSNGEHFFYARTRSDSIEAWYDGNKIQTKLDEVREVYLSRDGGAYGFFGRPLGEKKYCLFTRYSGNLCGFDGYMNPVLWADGTSILYTGYKWGVWRIYRNTYPIIQDTKYSLKTNGDNSGDYAFYDTTNPKTYVILEKNTEGKYEIRKNGKVIPKVWEDVGIDVYFGYDNTVIMTAKDSSWWRIIEI